MKNKKFLAIVILSVIMTVTLMPTPSYANYSSGIAINNAQHWAIDGYGISWYTFSSDCTNFVSTCEWSNTGLDMVDDSIKEPSLTEKIKGLSVNDDVNQWYMEQKQFKVLGVKRNVWCYTKSWSCVKDFRDFNGLNDPKYSFSSVTPYVIYTDSDIDYLCSRLKVGDVIQKGDKHSVMITVYGTDTKTIKYSGHSTNRKNEPLSTFIKDCTKDHIYTVYVIHYGY